MSFSLHYIAFPTAHPAPLSIAARLRVPDSGPERHPAVLILHGSAGPSGREGGYADVLNDSGFVTLEPDQWSARGLKGGADGRPRTVVETLPDLFGAYRYLAAHPKVDSRRIGVMGFSFGGVATMLATTRAQADRADPPVHFAAYMPLYPVCWMYNNVRGYEFGDLVGAPILIVTGALDQYDNDPDAVHKLVAPLAPADRALITTFVVPEAHHGFDMPGVDIVVQDPGGNRGAGGSVVMRCNPEAMSIAHRLAADFFTDTLGDKTEA